MGLMFAACHAKAGTHPEDMSAAEHDKAAAEAEAEAVEEEAQYDPNTVIFDGSNCSEFCFRANPTEIHLQEANRLRREAAAHRDASHDLQVAEERACGDIPELHRDFSPFYHVDHITGAELEGDGPIVVHFDAIPKTTAEGLQRLVDCHVARNAVLGYDIESMGFCPLAVEGVEATVEATDGGFDIELKPGSDEARAEVRARVEALTQ